MIVREILLEMVDTDEMSSPDSLPIQVLTYLRTLYVELSGGCYMDVLMVSHWPAPMASSSTLERSL